MPHDIEKIKRILSSELVATYGLTVFEKDVRILSEQVWEWWNAN